MIIELPVVAAGAIQAGLVVGTALTATILAFLLLREQIGIKGTIAYLVIWALFLVAAVSYSLVWPWGQVDWEGDGGEVGLVIAAVVVSLVVIIGPAVGMFINLFDPPRKKP